MLTGGAAGLLAGLVDVAHLQYAGLGAHGGAPAIRFVAAGALLGVPVGVLVGMAICLVLTLVPASWARTLNQGVSAPLIYAVGLTLPLVVAISFHSFLWVSGHFRNLSLAALVSALVTTSLLLAFVGFGATVGMTARVMARRVPWLGSRTWAVAIVLACGIAVSLPGLIAGPDRALLGPFGFVGLFRKDTLDYAPWITAIVFALGLATAGVVSRSGAIPKLVLGGLLGVSVAASVVVAAGDAVRPLILEHGLITRASLRGMQLLGDWDGDGFSSWLGGGDCDDGDARRHPGAHEIPGNGIDEDCDGEDLQPENAEPIERVRLSRSKAPEQLSFLLLTVDALRPDLGCLGYERSVSPNIDKLAQQATVFENAYAISTYTGFSLPPMMASRYPSEMPRTNRHEVQYFSDNVLLAERLRGGGFRTEGAASHFLFAPELGWIDGFEHFLRGPLEGNAPPGSHVDLYHSSRGLADAAISLLSNREITSGSFFIWVHFLDPHKQYLEHPGFSTYGREPRDLYDGEVAFTDFHIGRVLDALTASQLASRTVVILTGDHGEAFGEHGEYFHGREIWEEIVRVPLIIRVPSAAPRRVARRVSHVDVAPTILDLAELPPDPNARGESLVPELFGVSQPERPILIDQPRNSYYPAKRAFIDRGMKLHHLIDANTFLLYDLEKDPKETHDLAAENPAALSHVRHAYSLLAARLADVEPVSQAESTAVP